MTNESVIIWKSNLTDKMKRIFFQAAVVSILLYGCTTWTLTKRLKKKLDGNYTRMLRAILNKSWRQHLTRRKLYSHLPPIKKTIQARRTRHTGHCSRSKDELISNVLLWTPTYGQAKAGRPARTYIQQLCEDTGCSPEVLPEAMNDREKWRERVRDIRASSTIWWLWWFRWNDEIHSMASSPFSRSVFPRESFTSHSSGRILICTYAIVNVIKFNFLHNSYWIVDLAVPVGHMVKLKEDDKEMKEAPNETRTHSCRFTSRVC